MIFLETKLRGAYLIEPERIEDERGFFARTFCEKEFESHALNSRFVQCSMSFNKRKGTVRGMHFQVPPYEEAKLVRCTRAAIHDVLIDLRPHSPTFKQWLAVQLTAENRRMVYVPEGFAHGFQTLEDNVEVLYQTTAFYQAESARGVRWDDPAFSIDWPTVDGVILSPRDRSFPKYDAPSADQARPPLTGGELGAARRKVK